MSKKLEKKELQKRGPKVGSKHRSKYVNVAIVDLLKIFTPETKIAVSSSYIPLLGVNQTSMEEITSMPVKQPEEKAIEFTITRPE